MSKTGDELIELVRASVDALNRGDFAGAAAPAHPEVVFVRPGGLSSLQGSKALREWMEPDAFESQQTELRSVEAEGNRVLVEQHTVARGAGSGIEMGIDTWALWTFDEGRVIRVELFLGHEEDEARRGLSGG
jgi:ketosteroid isomerase-like protein